MGFYTSRDEHAEYVGGGPLATHAQNTVGCGAPTLREPSAHRFGAIVIAGLAVAVGLAQTTVRVSLSYTGEQGNLGGEEPVMSPDGRFVVFISGSSNLVPFDTNNRGDIFRRDRATAETIRINLRDGGTLQQMDGFSEDPALSADGRHVAFRSDSRRLVLGDTNGVYDIFVRDTLTQRTVRVSVSSAGEQANDRSFAPALSADGRWVAFYSAASNLVAGDTNEIPNVFIHDRDPDRNGVFDEGNGITEWIDRGTDGFGIVAGAGGWTPEISADGRYVAFVGGLNAVLPTGRRTFSFSIFMHDRLEQRTWLASVGPNGEHPDRHCYNPAISADGRYVAFDTTSSTLVERDTNFTRDVFVHDNVTGVTERVSVTWRGAQTLAHSYEPSLSADGRFVAYRSQEVTLVPGDTNTWADVFVYDRWSGRVMRASLGHQGQQPLLWSNSPAISADGRQVVFESFADNLVPGDTNQAPDVFVRDLGPCVDFVLYDGNCDGAIDERDIDALMLALASPKEYARRYPGCEPLCALDANADGRLDGADVDPLVERVRGRPAPRDQVIYHVTPLGIPAGTFKAIPYKFNERGQVAGLATRTNFVRTPFLWDPIEGYRLLGVLPGDPPVNGGGLDVNNLGHVVGSTSAVPGAGHVFFWTPEAGMIGMGRDALSANAVNDQDEAVGHGSFGRGQEAYIWDPWNGLTVIGDLPGGGVFAVANDINNSIQVVGTSDGGRSSEAFLWDPFNGIRTLGDIPGGGYARDATDINENGRITGGADTFAGPQAYTWHANEGFTLLGNLPGSAPSSAGYGINDDGIVVGLAGTSRAPNPSGFEFIWTREHGMRSLWDLIAPSTPWELRLIQGFLKIDNTGRILGAVNAVGEAQQPVILTPFIIGDMNCDATVNGADIDPFFLALGDYARYEVQYPNCHGDWAGDVNQDARFDAADIDLFFQLLGGG
ncbi:MAG: PD40 domain-containing protein [Planctomycetes bacterium]|nr:PD40 domain-containing protein [Planctomycetota bacterium]